MYSVMLANFQRNIFGEVNLSPFSVEGKQIFDDEPQDFGAFTGCCDLICPSIRTSNKLHHFFNATT
jgi:hypothetical protein